MSHFLNKDCMEVLRDCEDNFFDLAIVDPPYFSGPERREYYGKKVSTTGIARSYRKVSKWEVPGKEYFDELMRVSKNQIIWGVQYFDYPFTPGRIVWDKCINGSTNFSDCEIAFCSMHNNTKLFRYMWNGMLQGKSISEGHIQRGNKRLNEKRIHPTQKPIDLYKWLLMKYAKPGDLILDTHVGSGSSLIACEEMGFEYFGCEIDPYYYDLALGRIEETRAQITISELMGGGAVDDKTMA